MTELTTVIVGAGHAGVQTAVRLRELEWSGRIVLVDPDIETPYERPPLSKELLKPETQETISPLRKENFYTDHDIELVGGAVKGLDKRRHEIVLESGQRIPYSKLVLAPGSHARRLTCPGGDLPGVLSLKTRHGAEMLKDALTEGARIVVVGAGYIGLEVAAAAAAANAQVTVLEFTDRVMKRVTSEPVSHFFEALHERQGTRFVFGAGVTEIRQEGATKVVVTGDGNSYEADTVVVGIGVVPLQGLAEEADVEVNDGIVVDADSRTSDPDIYAAGDATRLIWPEKDINRRLESIQSAVAQAINAANHIAGQANPKREVPWFWTVQHGVRLQTAGLRGPDDDVVIRGNPEDGKFSVLYVRDGRITAIDTVGSLKDFTPGKKLIGAEAAIDVTIARDMTRKLTEAALEPVASVQ